MTHHSIISVARRKKIVAVLEQSYKYVHIFECLEFQVDPSDHGTFLLHTFFLIASMQLNRYNLQTSGKIMYTEAWEPCDCQGNSDDSHISTMRIARRDLRFFPAFIPWFLSDFFCCFYLWSTCTILFDMCSLNGKNASVNRFTKMVVKSRTSHRSTKWSHGSLFFTHAKNIELKSKTLAAVASLNWSYTSFKPSRIKGDAAGSLYFMWVIKVIGVIGVRSRSKLHRSMVGRDWFSRALGVPR